MIHLSKYFPELTPDQIKQFTEAKRLYTSWNDKINVISRKDIDQLEINHFVHSLTITKYCSLESAEKVLDVGTGGGFPGIPLAIYYPHVSFTLADSIGKKISVVQAIADEIGLDNVTAIKSRVEDLDDKYDFITCRAVAKLANIKKWTKKLTKEDTRLLALKGGDLKEEIKASKLKTTLHSLYEDFPETQFKDKVLLNCLLQKS